MRKPKPAISRVLSSTTIHLGQLSPAASSNLPGSPFGTDGGPWALTPLFGLAPGGVYRAASCYQSRGALLPHLFTLTSKGPEDNSWRYIFCGTFHGLTPPRRYLAPCPKEPGLSSASRLAAIAWPTPALSRRILQERGRRVTQNMLVIDGSARVHHFSFERICSNRS